MLKLFSFKNKRSISNLSEAEMIALAISAEEDDARIFRAYADKLRGQYPENAAQFDEMAREEDGHRQALITLYKMRFGDQIPLMRREYVSGFPPAKADWISLEINLETARENARSMERTAEAFYIEAAKRSSDASTRKLLGDLAAAEAGHVKTAGQVFSHTDATMTEDKEAHRNFILTYVQPGLAGLIDGSISTLAPIFAAAFATGSSFQTLLVGLSASIGAGISMGFTEAISDDGVISGRGSPIIRGMITGLMTTIGGLGHALPYMISDVWTATLIAAIIVVFELSIITWIQHKYMETPWLKALLQIVLGGALVLAAGILIGSA